MLTWDELTAPHTCDESQQSHVGARFRNLFYFYSQHWIDGKCSSPWKLLNDRHFGLLSHLPCRWWWSLDSVQIYRNQILMDLVQDISKTVANEKDYYGLPLSGLDSRCSAWGCSHWEVLFPEIWTRNKFTVRAQRHAFLPLYPLFLSVFLYFTESINPFQVFLLESLQKFYLIWINLFKSC